MTPTASSAGKLFGYGFGRVGVLQEYLLTEADVGRLLAARNDTELTQMLTELKMSARVEYSAHPHRFIHNLERWFRDEIRSMTPDENKAVFDILWIKDDASLLAYLLKRHHGFTSEISAEPHVGATAFDPDSLRAIVLGNDSPSIPGELARFVRDMRESQGMSPKEIDTKVARFVAEYQCLLAEQSGSRGIQRYVAHHIDLQNIRTAHRLRQDEHLPEYLLKGGEIDFGRFSLEAGKLSELIYSSGLPASLADSISSSENSAETLERGLAKAIAHDVAAMRANTLTIDPIFAFAAIALSQLKLLRTIIIGKSASLTPDEIKQLLPPFLSASPFPV